MNTNAATPSQKAAGVVTGSGRERSRGNATLEERGKFDFILLSSNVLSKVYVCSN